MNRRALPIETVVWRRKQPKHVHQKSMGIQLTHLHGEDITMALTQRICQYHGCTVTLSHFELQSGTANSKLTAYGKDKHGRIDMLTIDHKIARCLGGKDDKSNKWLMCHFHNQLKARAETWLFNTINRKKQGELNQ